MIAIRKAEPGDLDAVIGIETACFPASEAASPTILKERIEAFGQYFLVAENEGTIVGMINGMPTSEPDLKDEMYENVALHDPKGKNVMIFGVDTLPSFQHQGIASQIMEAFIDQAKKDHKQSIILTCKKELIAFYERFGYVNEGISASVHGHVVWYQMRLML